MNATQIVDQILARNGYTLATLPTGMAALLTDAVKAGIAEGRDREARYASGQADS